MKRCEQKKNTFNTKKSTSRETLISYKYCGSSYTAGSCPAYGKRCLCHDKSDHFEKVCHSRQTPSKQRAVHEVYQDNEETEMAAHEFDVVRSSFQLSQH